MNLKIARKNLDGELVIDTVEAPPANVAELAKHAELTVSAYDAASGGSPSGAYTYRVKLADLVSVEVKA